jgi:hypothetical protein
MRGCLHPHEMVMRAEEVDGVLKKCIGGRWWMFLDRKMVIDCFSQYVWVRALKTKNSVEVTKAFKSILVNEKRQPNNLQTHQGKEFFNVEFNTLMKKYNINHYNTYRYIAVRRLV